MKASSDYSFTNWAGNIKCRAANYAQPETEEEIISLLRKHKKVRVVGSGHSWSALCETDDLLLNMDKLNKILELDKTAKTVRVQGGVKLHELNAFLDKVGFALSNLGSISQQSIAGAITTGTHGTGIRFQCLASQVLSFTLIKADGTKEVFNKGEELFNAIIISLGCLGIISELTLQITECFNLHDKTYTDSFAEVIEKIDEYLAHDHFKLWWLPPTDKAVIYTYRRTNEACNDSRFRQIFNDEILSVWAYRTLVKAGNIRNSWRVPINRFLTSQIKPLDRIEKSFMVFNVPEPPKHRETEWAFDVKDAKALLREYRELFTTNDLTFNFIQEVRFTKGDEFWLSECHERDTVWICAYNHEDRQWDTILETFEQFAKKHHGRPHWGKEFTPDREYLSKQYPKYDDFIALRNQYDPEGKFSNKLTDTLFPREG